MVERSEHDLLGRRGWDGAPVEVPLADRCRRRRPLDAARHGQGPQVNESKVDAEPPGTGVEHEEESSRFAPASTAAAVAGPRDVPAQEDTREHGHPDPGPQDDDDERGESEQQEGRVGRQDPTAKLEHLGRLPQRPTATVHGVHPQRSCEDRKQRQPPHGSVLEGRALVGTPKAGDKGVYREGREDDGDGDEDDVDQGPDEGSQQRQPEQRDDDGHQRVDGQKMKGRA